MASNTAPSPYGTRSRQRSTAQRINYAEDKDNDMDFEYTNNAPATSNTRSSNASVANAPDTASNTTITAIGMSTRSHGVSAGSSSRRSSTVANQTQAAVSQPSPPPPPPPPAATNATANSRKRKSTAAPPPVATSTTATLTNGTSTRPSARSNDRAKERQKMRDALTHQVTFEKYGGAFLSKGGYLEADDGTRLSVNGENPLQFLKSIVFPC